MLRRFLIRVPMVTVIGVCAFAGASCTFNPRLSAATGCEEDEWRQFRGPNGSGVAKTSELPTEFDRDHNLVWRVELSSGHSSPVISDGRIYLTGVERDQLLTFCLDQASGSEIWRATAPRNRQEPLDPRNHPASPTPVVDDSGVYVFFPDYGMLAYSLDGELKWKAPLGPFTNIYGMGASPIIVNNRLVLVCDQNVGSYIVAFDKQNGSRIWQTSRPEATSGHCTPIAYLPADDQPQIIAVGSFYVTSYSVATGEKLWWVGGLCFEMKSTPVIGDDMLFINGYGSPQNEIESNIEIPDFDDVVTKHDTDGDGQLAATEGLDEMARNFFPAIDLDSSGKLDENEWKYYQTSIASKNSLMAIRLGGAGDMTNHNIVWKYYRNIPQLPSPVYQDGVVWMINDAGIVTSLDAKSGAAIKRGRLQGASGNVYASPVIADGKLFFVTEAGKVAVAKADGEFEVQAVNDLGERCYATPIFDDRRIYVRTEKALYAFGLEN